MNAKHCPFCGSQKCVRKGKRNGHQRWQCKACTKKFQANRKAPPQKEELFCLYAFNKQTLAELSRTYGKKTRRIQEWIDACPLPKKYHDPRPIALAVDTTFFGDFGVCVFRDAIRKENLWFRFVEEETLSVYRQGRSALESLGYEIRSVTGDGLPGLPAVFTGIPFQYCHFHAKKNITKYLTRNPKTEAGRDLVAIMHAIPDLTEESLLVALNAWELTYKDFLSEKTVKENGKWEYTHRRLRSALKSLRRMSSYLYTYRLFEGYYLPTTTNTLEGHFTHIKVRVRVHRGLSRRRKEKMISLILLNSSATYMPDLYQKLWK